MLLRSRLKIIPDSSSSYMCRHLCSRRCGMFRPNIADASVQMSLRQVLRSAGVEHRPAIDVAMHSDASGVLHLDREMSSLRNQGEWRGTRSSLRSAWTPASAGNQRNSSLGTVPLPYHVYLQSRARTASLCMLRTFIEEVLGVPVQLIEGALTRALEQTYTAPPPSASTVMVPAGVSPSAHESHDFLGTST